MLEEIAECIADDMADGDNFDNCKIGPVHARAATLHTVASASFKLTDETGRVFVVRVTRAE